MNRLRRWWRRRQYGPFDWAQECPELTHPVETHVRLVASSAEPRELT